MKKSELMLVVREHLLDIIKHPKKINRIRNKKVRESLRSWVKRVRSVKK